jgi:hypothetical protein
VAALTQLQAATRRERSRLSKQQIGELIDELGGMLAVLTTQTPPTRRRSTASSVFNSPTT